MQQQTHVLSYAEMQRMNDQMRGRELFGLDAPTYAPQFYRRLSERITSLGGSIESITARVAADLLESTQ